MFLGFAIIEGDTRVYFPELSKRDKAAVRCSICMCHGDKELFGHPRWSRGRLIGFDFLCSYCLRKY